MAFIQEVMESVFVGFGLFILVTSFIRFGDEQRNKLLLSLTDSAVTITCLAAIGFLITWFVNIYELYQSEQEYYTMLERMTGPYWIGYWIYAFAYGVFPQLLWIKKIKRIKTVRIVTALLLLFALYVERMVIWITSFHRDYVPSNWTLLPGYLTIYDWVVNLLIFGVILGTAHFIRSRLINTSHVHQE